MNRCNPTLAYRDDQARLRALWLAVARDRDRHATILPLALARRLGTPSRGQRVAEAARN